MMPYRRDQLTPVEHRPSSLSRESSVDRRSTRAFCPSRRSIDIEAMQGFQQMCPTSLGYEMDMIGNYRQYSCSPITVEMEKFFSYPTMSITFMPCVCVPDYPVEEGKPRKICRRCSIAPGSEAAKLTRYSILYPNP